MSRVRGVFPLFLATTIGIVNGIWVFGPAFQEQQEQKSEEARKVLEVPSTEDNEIKILLNAEAVASRSSATESALKPVGQSSSWWPNVSLWSQQPTVNSSSIPSEAPREDQKKNGPKNR